METAITKLYEAMFLVDSALAGSNWDGVISAIKNIMKRAEAEILLIQKWGEKKLAYEIGHKSRGTYILCYFKADGDKIGELERDVQLSEQIMRVLVLRADKHQARDIEKDIARRSAKNDEQADSKVSQEKAVVDEPQQGEKDEHEQPQAVVEPEQEQPVAEQSTNESGD